MEVPSAVHEKMTIAASKASVIFSFLEEYGYHYEGYEVITSELLKVFVLIKFQSDSRSINVGYYPYERKDIEKDDVSLLIGRIPKRGGFNSISAQLYAENHCPDVNLASLEFDSYDGAFEDKLSAVFYAYAYFLDGCARRVVSGEEWVEDSYVTWY